ncbi:MAG: M28 family peptidase, partial [Planctomycetes bacterium]|nr:M28 family peptidase [Planctomycetota bacterium]
SVEGTPGANDNGTGAVALIEFARAFAGATPARTLRLVAFVNEEPPYFQRSVMGSLVYARRCQERKDRIAAMISLETIGYYTDEPDSQHFPLAPLAALYPSTGNFAAVVGQGDSIALVNEVVERFRRLGRFPCEGVALPAAVEGAGWSDHWSFAQCGYPGVMITDTAPFRYPHYHEPTDTVDQIVWDRYARVVEASIAVVAEMVQR